ncbi:DgyrCDS331 [Dimorphilus gyrociliatus]|uniref:Phosphorylase b kinase regulatory subunit n=1 Tax=Dimorphilus gyrociliatus TaxID=2664684 RepID=A0A7I8V8P0_9ANNE|nr:DgyrCDS331 [Dimorphilus gyrociliatus]
MRSRSNSGVRLDFYQRMVYKTILKHQNPVTGLLPATADPKHSFHDHAWVRDNVYSILAVWGLALAYKKNADLDEDRAKAYELEQSVVKLMRGLLTCMMRQMNKVEKFKYTQSPKDALHAKYSVTTGATVVSDDGWGHLQIDATSFYLLILAQMTASGLQIIYTMDEVSFIQNLVFYIQSAYRTPDYGIWERGDKTNHGLPELNTTSIGMAKAALEAMNELDLFGARGGPYSVIHVLPDEAQQCQAILQSVLPRESNSKEVDAALMGIISYPAFAVDDQDLIQLTKNTIVDKLMGEYGCCRFIRDGYKTAREDPNRLHYEPWELSMFENIECEWPLFIAFFVLDAIFNDTKADIEKYMTILESLMIKGEDGIKLMPEMYRVPAHKVEEECYNPGSQIREPIGKVPQTWGQSLYILCKLLMEGFLSPGEIDPLNRRLVTEQKPDLVVQVVILAEDEKIQEKLAENDIKVQTLAEASPVQVYPAKVLSHIFSHLGKNSKLGLTGRPTEMAGILATSKLYTLGDKTLVFMPQFVDKQEFYLPLDLELLLDMLKTDVQHLQRYWNNIGRPLMVFPIKQSLLDFKNNLHPALIATMKKLQTGYINGTRVQLGFIQDFMNTSCATCLTYLTEADDSPDIDNLLEYIGAFQVSSAKSTYRILDSISRKCSQVKKPRARRKSTVSGFLKKSLSIQIAPEDVGETPSSENVSPTPPCSPLTFTPPERDLFQPKSHLKAVLAGTTAITHHNESLYEGIDCIDLVDQLRDSESLHEQADIIYYLYLHKGVNWETNLEGPNRSCKVRDLLAELYDRAGDLKQWWLVRHTAGMLRKKVENLALSATDILVRQKQLAVGLPPEPREKIITRPLPPDELADMIHEACGRDLSIAMLTQELLVYLAMFIRTEPKLFHEMLRLRIGLIIQVMASELARTLKCSGDDASDQLLNLSPYEMKTLLHHILSGKEFGITSAAENVFISAGDMIREGSRTTTKVRSRRSSMVAVSLGML